MIAPALFQQTPYFCRQEKYKNRNKMVWLRFLLPQVSKGQALEVIANVCDFSEQERVQVPTALSLSQAAGTKHRHIH